MYFNKYGKENTEATIKLAIKTAREQNIKTIVISSSTGYSMQYFKDVTDLNIVCVAHSFGYPIEGKNEMSEEVKESLINKGFKVLMTTHVLSGAERGLSAKFGGISPVEVMANTLRMFGQGTKVCVEISVMAVDSGLAPYMEPIIAVGGTAHGVDTALILRASHASKILDTKIDQVICKPIL